MPRLLQYVSGVRLIADPYDRHLWHFAIQRRRYDLRARRGRFLLQTEGGAPLGMFDDWNRAIACAREHRYAADTERIPVVASGMHPSLST